MLLTRYEMYLNKIIKYIEFVLKAIFDKGAQ